MDNLIKKAKSRNIDAEITSIDTEITPLRFESGKLMDSNTRNIRECALRIVKDGRLGTTESTGSTAPEEMWEAAEFSSNYGEQKDLKFPEKSINSDEFVDDELLDWTISDQVKYSKNLIKKINSKNPDIPVDLTVTKTVTNLSLKNTTGLDSSFRKTGLTIWIQGLVPGSKVGIIKETGKTKLHDVPEEMLDELAEEFRALSKTSTVKSGKLPVFFTPGAAWSLIYRFYAGVNAENINREISPLVGRIGDRLTPDFFNLYDDPFFEDSVDGRPFDDEGVQITKKPVIEKGVLKNYLYDIKSGLQAGVSSTGNGFRKSRWVEGIQFAPNPQFASMVVYPGEKSSKELISSIDYGIIVDYVLGFHSGNIVNGDYSMNVGVGYKVENGKLTSRVMDAMIFGNVYTDFPNLAGISNRVDKSFKGYCPALLFSELNVAGTE